MPHHTTLYAGRNIGYAYAMQPNAPQQPYYTPPPVQPNPYEFITNSGQPQKPGLLGGPSFKRRLLIVVGGGLVLLLVFIILFSVIFGSGGGNTDQLKALAQEQQEIARVAEIGNLKAKSPNNKALAITTKLSVQTDQNQLTTLLEKQGIKLNSKDLALKKDADTDATLTQAEQNNRFDEVFAQIMDEKLAVYQKSLQAAYQNSSKNTKSILDSSYKSAGLLVAMPAP